MPTRIGSLDIMVPRVKPSSLHDREAWNAPRATACSCDGLPEREAQHQTYSLAGCGLQRQASARLFGACTHIAKAMPSARLHGRGSRGGRKPTAIILQLRNKFAASDGD